MAAGNLDFGLTTEDILTAGDGVETTVIQATDLTGMGGGVVVPGGTMLLTAEFTQEGSDLVLTGADGSIVVIQDYFSVAESPALETSGGAQLPADLVMNLAHAGSPIQVAQDGGGALDEPIGTVDTAVGGVVIRADGTRVELEPGSPVYQGDVLQSETGGAIEITFIDDTAFTIEEGRMVLDELVFDPETNEGSSSFSVVQGFVSGAIAKTGSDAMTVRTPVATIGIRGTQVAVQAAAEGEENVITLLQEEGGITGEIVVSNSAGSQVLNEAFATTTIQSFFTAPSEPVILPEAQVNQMFGGAVAALQANIAGREAREEARAEEARAEEAAAEGEGEAEAEGEDEGEGEGEAEAEAEAEAEGEGEGEAEVAEEAAEEAGEEVAEEAAEEAAEEVVEEAAEEAAAEAAEEVAEEAAAEVAEEAPAEVAEEAPVEVAEEAAPDGPAEVAEEAPGEAAAEVAEEAAVDDLGGVGGEEVAETPVEAAAAEAADPGADPGDVAIAEAAAEIAGAVAAAGGGDVDAAAAAAFDAALAGDGAIDALVETAAGGDGFAGVAGPDPSLGADQFSIGTDS